MFPDRDCKDMNLFQICKKHQKSGKQAMKKAETVQPPLFEFKTLAGV
jgi:hypothetical protein